jgi:hypothetical protein
VLYYGFSVMLVPLEADLAATRAQVAGAYSLGLLMMALVAPAIGRRIDRDHGVQVMRAGLALATAGLVLLAFVATLPWLYVAWSVLGLAMGALLYEPAFGLVNRAIGDDAVRLRALSAVTVIGGLASTVFLPTLAVLVETLGWRAAALAGAVAVLAAGWRLERGVFAGLAPVVVELPAPPHQAGTPERPRGFIALTAIFVAGTVSGMALTVLLVPALIERGAPPTLAASALAALGLSQLPGRVWLLRVQRELPAGVLTLLPLLSQAAGLVLVAFAPGVALAACGVVVFGAGAGLQTLLRPWLVRRLFGGRNAGALNGHVARSQGIARAFAPLAAAAAATAFGTPAVFVALALLLAAMIPVSRALVRSHAAVPAPAG